MRVRARELHEALHTRPTTTRTLPRWLAENVGRFVATWLVVGTLVAAAVASADDDFEAPGSVVDAVSAPFSVLAIVVAFAFAAAAGLLLLSPAWLPCLAVYLAACWYAGRALSPRRSRLLAVALSPLLSLFFMRGGLDGLSAAALAGSVVYGFVLKLP